MPLQEKIKILSLEDTPSDAELQSRALRRSGLEFDWFCVDNEKSFHLAVESFQPNIILADYSLPSYDGASALEHIQATHPAIPVIIVTGALGEEKVVELLRAGAVDYILKDRLGRLPDAISRAMENAQSLTEKNIAVQSLVESDELLRQAQAIAHLGSWRWQLDTDKIYWSEESFRIFGLVPDRHGHNPRDFIERVAFSDDIEIIWNEMSAARNGIRECNYEARFHHPDGQVRWVHGQAKLISDANRKPLKLVGTILDVTERKLLEVRLNENLGLLQMALEGAQECVWEWNLRTGEAKFGKRFYAMLGYLPEDFPANQQEWMSRIHSDDRDLVMRKMQVDLSVKQDIYSAEYRVRAKDGQYRWIQSKGKCTSFDVAGHPIKMVGVNMDIDERKHMEMQVHQLAYHDKLTGLPNRALLLDRISQAMSQADREKTLVAVLFADLDGFKQINDMYGHKAGDEVLKMAAQRFLGCVRAVDTVARFGGDEFAVVVGNLKSAQQAAMIAEKIVELFADEVELTDGVTCKVGVSIGVSIFPEHHTTLEGLLSAADQAMYFSKRAGKNTYTYYTVPEASEFEAELISLEDEHLVGIAQVDEQHQNLVRLINQFILASCNGEPEQMLFAIFDELLQAITDHFESEEHYMLQYGYPEQSQHKHEHDLLISEFIRVKGQFRKGDKPHLQNMMKTWLLDHIISSDLPMAHYCLESRET